MMFSQQPVHLNRFRTYIRARRELAHRHMCRFPPLGAPLRNQQAITG